VRKKYGQSLWEDQAKYKFSLVHGSKIVLGVKGFLTSLMPNNLFCATAIQFVNCIAWSQLIISFYQRDKLLVGNQEKLKIIK
jgi:hypothetical protein